MPITMVGTQGKDDQWLVILMQVFGPIVLYAGSSRLYISQLSKSLHFVKKRLTGKLLNEGRSNDDACAKVPREQVDMGRYADPLRTYCNHGEEDSESRSKQ